MGATGLEYWHEAAGTDIAPDAVARMRSHPRHADALRASVAGALDFLDREPQPNALFLDLGSFALGLIALYLDATGGISHRHLRTMSQSSSVLSGGRASAILALLRLKRFVRRDAEGAQARYRPEPPLKHFFHHRFRLEIEALIAIDPAVAPMAACWDEPGMFERFIAFVGAGFVDAGPRSPDVIARINRIGARRAGMLILYQMMQSADRGGAFPAEGPFKISLAATARRFGVSRAHVRRVVRQIESEGYMTHDGNEGEGVLLPLLIEDFGLYSAYGQISLLACAHRVLSGEAFV